MHKNLYSNSKKDFLLNKLLKILSLQNSYINSRSQKLAMSRSRKFAKSRSHGNPSYYTRLSLVSDDDQKILGSFKTLSLAYSKDLYNFADCYACEACFPKMNFIHNEFRSKLAQNHIDNCLLTYVPTLFVWILI